MMRRDVVEILQREVTGAGRGVFLPPSDGAALQISSAPGRLDVLGGLGVQVGGTVAQMALPLRTAVAVQLSPRPVLTIHSEQMGDRLSENRVEIPLPAALGDHAPWTEEIAALACGANAWAAPVVALWRVLEHAEPSLLRRGAAIMIKSDTPIRAGQASSTALLAALAVGLAGLRPEPYAAEIDPAQIATYIQQAEDLCGTGGPGAALDAMTCLLAGQPLASPEAGYSPRGALLRYSAQPCELMGHVPLPEGVRILALDTGVRYTSAAAALGELRVAGAMGLKIIETIYRDLGQAHTPLHGYLANTSPVLYRQYFRALLPRRLRGSDFIRTYGTVPAGIPLDPARMYRVRTAVDHFIAENEHAEQFLQAMEELSERDADGQPVLWDSQERQRTLQRAGRLALASHHSYRLRLELSCREADWLVDRLMEAGPERGVYGARITGAGGGGTVMALVDHGPSAGDAILEVIGAYAQFTGHSLPVVEAGGPGSAGALLANPAT